MDVTPSGPLTAKSFRSCLQIGFGAPFGFALSPGLNGFGLSPGLIFPLPPGILDVIYNL